MTLKDIIDDVGRRIQHTLSEDDIVMYANYALSDVRRVAAKFDVYSFDTTSGVSIYPLPTYIAPEGIKTVTVGGGEYLPKRLNEASRDSYYHITPDGFLQLSPTPRGGKEVLIAYEGVELFSTLAEIEEGNPTLTEEEKSELYYGQDPNIDEEYSQLIPLSVASAVAEEMEDLSRANNLMARYNALYRKAEQGKYLKRGKYPVTRMVQ